MTIRAHTADHENVTTIYVNNFSDYFVDDEMPARPGLAIEDPGNMEAFVIIGSPNEIAAFARRILQTLPTVLTAEEESYLAHICEQEEYDREQGAIGRSEEGWAWFLSDEDATSYDLTNQQLRELHY